MTSERRTVGIVALDQVHAHTSNVRKDLGDLRPLAGSIKRHGVMVPIVVEKRGGMLRLRDGHRRLVAARMAGRTRIPAVIYDEALDENQWAIQAVEINEHRRGLDAAERRATIKRLRKLGWQLADIADAYGVTPQTISRWTAEPKDPDRSRPPKLTRAMLAVFVDEWRRKPDATVGEVLDALDEVAGAPTSPEPEPADRIHLLERITEVIDLVPTSTFHSVAHRLDIDHKTVDKTLRRAGRHDLIQMLGRNRETRALSGVA